MENLEFSDDYKRINGYQLTIMKIISKMTSESIVDKDDEVSMLLSEQAIKTITSKMKGMRMLLLKEVIIPWLDELKNEFGQEILNGVLEQFEERFEAIGVLKQVKHHLSIKTE